MAVSAQRYAAHLGVRTRLGLKRWFRRTLFLIGGIAVGAAAVLMAKLADGAQALFVHLLTIAPNIQFLVTPLGFGFAVFLTRRVFPNSQGSGIPQAIAALQLEDPAARAPLVSLRVAFGKIIVMTIGLLCGASVGREGPTVQVGAAIGPTFAAVGAVDHAADFDRGEHLVGPSGVEGETDHPVDEAAHFGGVRQIDATRAVPCPALVLADEDAERRGAHV